MSGYEVRISPRVLAQLAILRAFDHVRIIQAIEENLVHEPVRRSRNRKPLAPTPKALAGLLGELVGAEVTVWELRVVPWRVAYAVVGREVHVLWVFRKGQETTDDAMS
jgi:hypothetical protein